MSIPLTEPAKPGTPPGSVPRAPLATVLHVCENLRRVFGSPSYKPPMLPSVALEIHQLSCQPDIDTNQLIAVLERDPMLAGHVLKVANSPAFRGRDPESSLRTAMLRLGLKNLGEVVFELALHMRVFRSASYSQAMEDLRRHSTACASLARMLAARTGHDPENAFLCGLLHDIGIAGILIVLGENQLSEKALEAHILDEVVRQTHEEVSGMLVQLWKLPQEVTQVVAKHHQAVTDPDAPRLSAVIALADSLTAKLGFSVDLGVGSLDQVDGDLQAAICSKLGIASEVMPTIEAEAAVVLKAVAQTLDHTKATSDEKPVEETKKSVPAIAVVKPSKAGPTLSARKKGKGLWARLRQALFGKGGKPR